MAFYLIENLEQGSQKWLNWRKGVLGASDTPAVLGENPWKTREYLMAEKLGRVEEFRGNALTREGQRLEPFAREAIENEYDLRIRPVVIQSAEAPFIAASLDGLTMENDLIFEIKCGKSSYEHVRQNGSIPKYYKAQLQHMLYVTEMSHLMFTVFRPEQETITLIEEYDDLYADRINFELNKFARELSRQGHSLQKEFIGELVEFE